MENNNVSISIDMLTDKERVKLTNYLAPFDPVQAIAEVNYLLDILSHNTDLEINSTVFFLSSISELFLGILTSEKKESHERPGI